jgi:hypothetical protein
MNRNDDDDDDAGEGEGGRRGSRNLAGDNGKILPPNHNNNDFFDISLL